MLGNREALGENVLEEEILGSTLNSGWGKRKSKGSKASFISSDEESCSWVRRDSSRTAGWAGRLVMSPKLDFKNFSSLIEIVVTYNIVLSVRCTT